MPDTEPVSLARRVTVVDVDVPFVSMVLFMVKWALAAIPALLILGFLAGSVAALILALSK